METLMTFLAEQYPGRMKTRLLCVNALAAVAAGAQFVSTWYLGQIIDAIAEGPVVVLRYFTVIAAAVACFVLGGAAQGYLAGTTANRFLRALRNRLAGKLCSAEYRAIEGIPEGDLLSITTRDIEGFRPWLSSLCSLGQIPVKSIVPIAALLLQWKLFVLMLPLIPLVMLPSLLLSRGLHAMNFAEKQAMGKAAGFLQDALDFILVVKSFCLEERFLRKNESLLEGIRHARLRRQLREQVIAAVGRCLGHISNPLVFILGGALILRGEMSVGQMVTVMLLMNIVGEALNLIFALPTGYQGAVAAMNRVRTVLGLADIPAGYRPAAFQPKGDDVYALRHVHFQYQSKPVLRGISLTIGRGEKIAVVGASGSGKTTLFKLLCGLLPPTEGVIDLHGADIATIPPTEVWNGLSVVPQETFLFPDTVAGNLLLAKPGAGYPELAAACEDACIAGPISALQNGYQTRLGDVGVSLSNGQMQRVSLARAFLRDAPVWLMDEPVSALDPATHDNIMGFLLAQEEKTIVLVLHEMKWPDRFDRILFLQDGQVAGFGPHRALMETNPAYRALLNQPVKEEAEE